MIKGLDAAKSDFRKSIQSDIAEVTNKAKGDIGRTIQKALKRIDNNRSITVPIVVFYVLITLLILLFGFFVGVILINYHILHSEPLSGFAFNISLCTSGILALEIF